jgi:SAM-dependent methyltransferase
MPQTDAWEKEYRNPKFVTNSNEPQLDFKHFVKWLRKVQGVHLENLRVLDLGCGTGKNSIFLAERGSAVTGVDISETALDYAAKRSKEANLEIEFLRASIGNQLSFKDNSFDLILDVVSSNSLSDAERQVYVTECLRLVKPQGHFFVKALCKDGDKNAINLLEKFPYKEQDTYRMPETGIIERVFTKDDILKLYTDFSVLHMERKSSYTIFNGKPYKRNFWLLYLQKV